MLVTRKQAEHAEGEKEGDCRRRGMELDRRDAETLARTFGRGVPAIRMLPQPIVGWEELAGVRAQPLARGE
jgi:hypothetical protein